MAGEDEGSETDVSGKEPLMPSMEQMDRNQKAIYWPATSTNNHGQQIISTAATARKELDVRWVPVKREVKAPNSRTQAIDVEIVADRALAMGSILWLGSVDDLPSDGIPTSGLFEIVLDGTTVDLKARHTRYEYSLSRFQGVLPTS